LRAAERVWLHARVLAFALRASFRRCVAALPLGGAWTFILPESPSVRVWCTTLAVGLVGPWLVLGRDASRRADGFREAVRLGRRSARLVLAELLGPAVTLAALALLWSGGAGLPALVTTLWGVAVLALADGFDRRAPHAGAAAVSTLVVVGLLLATPWLCSPWMGQGLGHWVATLTFGLHPAGIAHAAAGRAVLQDPFFYTWTLSGTVDARPMAALHGLVFLSVLAVFAAGFSVRSARRALRSTT
jgi:hypothetical protein